MSLRAKLIQGGQHKDHRGMVTFLNDFDMNEVKRFYIIQNKDTETIRAWRAHRIEQRWFYVLDGEFLIRLVKIDNWESPDKSVPIENITLSAKENQVLHIPKGYGSWIQATQGNSKLLVFADYGIENAERDNYLYPLDYFESKTNIHI